MADAVFVIDAESLRFVDCNLAACQTYGYSRQQLLRMSPLDLHSQPERELAGRRLRSKKWALREYHHVTKNGRRLTVEINTTNIRHHGRPAHLSIVHDITQRSLAQQKLALHVQNTPLAVIEWNTDFQVTDWNPAAEQIFGYSREEALGREGSFIVPEHARKDIDKVWSDLLACRGGARSTNQNRTRDERLIYCEWYNTPLVDNSGTVIGVASLCQDVTERIRAQQSLSVQKAYLEQLFESAPEGIAIIGAEQRIVRVNREFSRIFGYSLEEAVGQSLETLVPPDRVSESRFIQRMVAKAININVETTRLRKDGSTVDVSILGTPIHGTEAHPAVYLIYRDITESKRAERALTESESKFRAVAETAASAICIHDGRRFLYANKACEHISGYTRDEFVAKPPFTLLDAISLEHVRESELPLDAPMRGEIGILSKNAGTRWIDAIANRIQFEGRSAVLVTGVDVTDRKRTEEALRSSEAQLRQSQKMEAVGRLAGGVAHDFNNLLTVIKGYSELAMEEISESDPLYAGVKEIQRAADRAASLTRQLLAFSRRQVLAPKVLDLNHLVTDTQKLLRRLMGEDVELITALDPQLGSVRADPHQIEQVLMNLAVNAKDAMPQGGEFTIETANIEFDRDNTREHVRVKSGAYVMLAVSDTGTGMDAETCSHVFEPFFTTKEQGKGTGLGLSTVYGIVKQSGGYIWAESEPGSGSSFKIYLPRVGEVAERPPARQMRPEAHRGIETILLVEDEAGVRALIRQVLQRHGYTVLDCSHGGEALLAAERHQGHIQLLLTDVVLPQMNGRELAERLLGARTDMKVLYMSGYTDEAIAHHGVLTPGSAFVQKPFTNEALARKVREVLDKK
jgi:two-component system, cell cycle sensor histidine kinase and response regulator CckA